MMTKLKHRWQRFLDGSTAMDPYKHVSAVAPAPAPSSWANTPDPYEALGTAVRKHWVPQEHLNQVRPEIIERDARRVESEKLLSDNSRHMLAEMDRFAAETHAHRRAARFQAGWSDVIYDRRHQRNMQKYQAPHGTIFMGLKHEPTTASSLNETMPLAWDILDRALHASDPTQNTGVFAAITA